MKSTIPILMVMPMLMGIGSINIRVGCNTNPQKWASSTQIDPPSGEIGNIPGQTGEACGGAGQCPCSTGNALFCGTCPQHTAEPCVYCPSGSFCPSDLCNGTTCPLMDAGSCPVGYPVNCGNGECCPSDYSTCCFNGKCAVDTLACGEPDDGGDGGGGGGGGGGGPFSCTASNPQVYCETLETCSHCTLSACGGPDGSACSFYKASDGATFGTNCNANSTCEMNASQQALSHCGCI